jgi:hypothetical protein
MTARLSPGGGLFIHTIRSHGTTTKVRALSRTFRPFSNAMLCGNSAILASSRFHCELNNDRHPVNKNTSGRQSSIEAQSHRQDAKDAKVTQSPSH